MILEFILLGVGAVMFGIGLPMMLNASKKYKKSDGDKKLKKKRNLFMILMIVGAYMILTRLITIIFGSEKKAFSVDLSAERIDILGISVSTTVIYTWAIMAVLIIVAVILRLTVVNHMEKVPKGMQNVLETIVGGIGKYTDSHTDHLGEGLTSYICTVGIFMIGCAILEMFGFRSPTSDITMTAALAIITFVLTNYYGLKRKKLKGRIKTLASPTPLVFPMKIISDIAAPVSLACRLFGNMLGGMIVMDLLYTAMGNNAIGIPSVIGLYFNVFHPVIQAFIFITLSLTYINEASALEGE